MKVQSKITEDVASRVAGDDVIPLIRTLKNRRDVSEFTLATETKREINLVRNMLYRLYNANLVTSIKKKDKKKGWYIYYWTLNLPRFQYLAKDLIKNRLSQLKERLKREKSSSFFMCQQNCIRLNFEQATDFEFKCPECGELLHQDDNTKKIKEIEREIKVLEKEFKRKLPVMKAIKEKPVKKKKAKKKANTKLKKTKKAKKKSAKKTKKKLKILRISKFTKQKVSRKANAKLKSKKKPQKAKKKTVKKKSKKKKK